MGIFADVIFLRRLWSFCASRGSHNVLDATQNVHKVNLLALKSPLRHVLFYGCLTLLTKILPNQKVRKTTSPSFQILSAVCFLPFFHLTILNILVDIHHIVAYE